MKKASFAVQLLDNAKAELVRNRNSLAECGRQLQAVRRQITHIIKMVCPVELGDRWSDKEYSITCRVDAVYSKPDVCFYLGNLDGFKDERLESILWYLSTLDGGREPRSCEYPQSLNRSYRFDFKDFTVRVDATVRSDSPTCRKIVVSSELVKQDKYAIQCD
jgi:hypothetical protein